MSGQIVRLLGIAPYEAMRNSLLHAAEAHPDIELDVRIGDLEDGADIVRQLTKEREYDAIISRGGTCELIRRETAIPVIDISISVYDVLRTIRLAQNYSGRFAVVGFSGITEPAHILCDMLRYHIDILTIRSEGEVRETLLRLRQLSIQAVVCDAVTHRTAREMGLSAFLIASGEESLHDALQKAESFGKVFREIRRDRAFLQLLLKGEPGNLVVMDESGTVLRASRSHPSPKLITSMKRHLRSIRHDADYRFYHRDQGKLHMVSGSVENFDGHPIYLFHDSITQLPLRNGHAGLRFLDREECEQLFLNSFFSISGAMGELEDRLPMIAAARRSVLIMGEEGTGREQIARALYLKSAFVNRPFTVVDCAQLTDKTWEFLMGHQTSPLADRDSVVYFHHLDKLSEDRWPVLLADIVESDLARRVLLLFSCTLVEGEPISERLRQFASKVGCQMLHLPTLRSRPDELPSLASLYLNSLNLELGKQIAGFDPGAMEQMVNYAWPSNYTQFKHVIEELAEQTQAHYISSNACYEVLRKERQLNRSFLTGAAPNGISYKNRTLDEIEADIVARALADNGGNHTATARQLGISRTTLWRIVRSRD